MLLVPGILVWDGELGVKPPTGPGVPLVEAVQLLAAPQEPLQLAVPENAQVWYPMGTGIEFAALDVHIKNMFAVKVRVKVVAVGGR
jgi:hypothetical protein